MSIKIQDNSSQIAGLGVNTDHEALVSLNIDVEKVGHVSIAMESNPQDVGVGRVIRQLDGTPDYRARIAMDSLGFADNFSHTVLNTSKWKIVNTTATTALGSGKLVLNSGSSVTSTQGTQVTSFATFKQHLSFLVYCEFEARITTDPQLYNIVEFGMGYVSGVAKPTDGVFFRINGLGKCVGVICYNSNEVEVQLMEDSLNEFSPTAGKMYHWVITIHNDETQFWVDNSLMGVITTPSDTGSPCQSMSLPVAMRIYNNNTVAIAQKFEVGNVSVSYGDGNMIRDWETCMSVAGQNSINAPDGSTAGQTTNYTNSAAPASATLSNTAAGYTTLGGQFQFAAVAGAETDYALFAFQNPAGTSANPAKNLIVKKIRISTYNSGAVVSTTNTVLQWALGVGSTAVSLATADSSATGTRSPRRLPLGVQYFSVGDVIGKAAEELDISLDAPIVVEPGTFLHLILKMPIGTNTASQIIRGIVHVNGYFE